MNTARPTTMLSLVFRLVANGLNEAQIAARTREDIASGRVKLTGTFRGRESEFKRDKKTLNKS